MKPMPETTWAAIRVTSLLPSPATSGPMTVKSAAPMLTRVKVRSPASLRRTSRSTPRSPVSPVATATRTSASHSLSATASSLFLPSGRAAHGQSVSPGFSGQRMSPADCIAALPRPRTCPPQQILSAREIRTDRRLSAGRSVALGMLHPTGGGGSTAGDPARRRRGTARMRRRGGWRGESAATRVGQGGITARNGQHRTPRSPG